MGKRRGEYKKTGGQWRSNLGDVLRLWRKTVGLTIREGAKEIGIPWHTLAAMETSRRVAGARTLLRVMEWMIRKQKSRLKK